MEALFVTGRIGIARREGNRRYYDLIERLVPPELLAVKESEEDGMTHAPAQPIPRDRHDDADRHAGRGDVQRRLGRRAGRAAPRGWSRRASCCRSRSRASRARATSSPPRSRSSRRPSRPGSLPTPGVSFLAPLDPLVWDRRLLRDAVGLRLPVGGLRARGEARWGYYVLPILFGDRFVGRIEPRLDRKAKDAQHPRHLVRGLASRRWRSHASSGALREAMEAYRSFVGADQVSWPRTRPGRDIAGALRRLAAA